MANVTARIKLKGKNFEIVVDCDKALAFKKGQGIIEDALISEKILSDIKKGLVVSDSDLNSAFKTAEVKKVAEKIIKDGEIQLPAEYKNKAREDKIKQIVDFIVTNCTDPKGIPHTPDRIKGAMEQVHINIDERKSAEDQAAIIIKKLQPIIPLKFETKKLKVQIPAVHAGRVYGILHEYVEKEEWLSDGSLSCILSMPAAAVMGFFDKLNNITHGSATTHEIKE